MLETQNVVKTASRVIPMIYCFTTPEIARHDGWTKIGYTEKQSTQSRQNQMSHTVDVQIHEEWRGNAIYDDGSGEIFTDHDFHRYLEQNGIERIKGTEWFHIDGKRAHQMFNDFRSRIAGSQPYAVSSYTLRDEQEAAVSQTAAYIKDNPGKAFLWNAKPRFGKTLSVYDLVKRIEAEKVLVVTNRPAVANSWYSDYEEFMGHESGYYFVSNSPELKGKKYLVSPDSDLLQGSQYIEFESLQDLKGSLYLGGKFDKFKRLVDTEWDLLVIDEAHEGIDTYKTDVAFDHIKRNFTLHLSGTPFKALANDKFPDNAIYNWTYADEAKAKRDWDENRGTNPYAKLPQMNMLTYRMSDIVKDEVSQGIEIDGEVEEYAFDLNEFFETNQSGHFVHEAAVNKFLDALTTQKKFPFSTPELRDELKHTLWLLNRVDSAKELAKKLKQHPVFSQYQIVLAAGDGTLDDEEAAEKAFKRVTEAIAQYDRTITISVGQLTTGVTIPEWTAVLMLSNMKSPALYMQAAFRAQNPCLFKHDGKYFRKQNCYVFDFDPARTLIIYDEFANGLSGDTARGGGTTEERKKHIRELLNFFPVIGEDENGEMIELDPEKVLSIPRKIKSQEVVKKGFMSNFLFANITNVFGVSQVVTDILNKMTPVKEPKNATPLPEEVGGDIPLDGNGNVQIPDEQIIGDAADLFGDKKYSDDVADAVEEQVQNMFDAEPDPQQAQIDQLKKALRGNTDTVIHDAIDAVKEKYGGDVRRRDENTITRTLSADAETLINKTVSDYVIAEETIKVQRQKELDASTSDAMDRAINQKYDEAHKKAAESFKQAVSDNLSGFVEHAAQTAVKTVETSKKQSESDQVQDDVRNHLRGFSRTIPSFIMAYGDSGLTLQNFDDYTEDDVFLEVTSITEDEFRFLRDGGDYEDPDTGETKHFEGHLFDETVFNDSIQEFLRLKDKLADYFDEGQKEDIFDYIPPQKTNQIYTPKKVVKQMVDMLEQENPGCFDDPDRTFADLYMKSGLYIAEIVKRLYRSPKMKELYPYSKARLEHILTKQVYGIAPTRIIFLIATNYILGFDEGMKELHTNFVQADTAEAAKNGTLYELVEKAFPQLEDK